MTAFYLWLNAVLYAGLAIWCTLRPDLSARSLGYVALDRSGRSEYLVIYGGLQLGLGLAFAWAAWRPEWQPAGLALALSLYAPIVLWRVLTIAMEWPVSSLTLGVAALEALLLIGAVAAWVLAH